MTEPVDPALLETRLAHLTAICPLCEGPGPGYGNLCAACDELPTPPEHCISAQIVLTPAEWDNLMGPLQEP